MWLSICQVVYYLFPISYYDTGRVHFVIHTMLLYSEFFIMSDYCEINDRGLKTYKYKRRTVEKSTVSLLQNDDKYNYQYTGYLYKQN